MTPHRMTSARLLPRVVLAGAAAVLAIVVGPVLPGAGAASGPTFGLRPAQLGAVSSPNGDFNYSVPAGGTINDAVVAENLTHAPLTLELFPADLIPLRGGGFGVSQLGSPMHSVGAWAHIQSAVSLGPEQDETIPFELSVPAGTLGGDYGGAIVAQNTPKRGAPIVIQTRVALEIHLHVTGASATLAARVASLGTNRQGGQIDFYAVVTNTGNESFNFVGKVLLQKSGSAVSVSLPMRPAHDYLLPRQEVLLTATWRHVPRYGSVTARAAVTATPTSGGSGTFTDQPIKLSFFPWLLLILAILALLLLLAVLREVWRRREQWRERLRESRARRRAIRNFKSGLAGTA